MRDAQTRLQTGGGLFGPEGITLSDIGKNTQQNTSIGFPINPYLWKGSLQVVSFMPLISADPFGGTILTDWYSIEGAPRERCKINVFINGVELKTQNLRVNSFCQTFDSSGLWIDIGTDSENNIKLENAILNKAKKLKLSQG